MDGAATPWLVAALLSAGCGVSGPHVPPLQTSSPVDREACEKFALGAEAQVWGGSIGAGAVMGAAAGLLAGAFAGAKGNSGVDEDEAVIIGAVVGGLMAVGGLIGAGSVGLRNASVRRAAYTEAMDACLRPARLSRELGPEHLEVAWSLHTLAFRYYRQGEFALAEPLFVRALAIQEKSLGVNAPEVATLLEDYARLLRRTGRAAEAESTGATSRGDPRRAVSRSASGSAETRGAVGDRRATELGEPVRRPSAIRGCARCPRLIHHRRTMAVDGLTSLDPFGILRSPCPRRTCSN